VDFNVFETANAGFAQAMYEEYLRDPAAVGPEWRRLFDSGVRGETPDYTGNGHPSIHGIASAGAGAAGRTAATTSPAPVEPTSPAAPAASAAPATTAPTGGAPLKGPAVRLVQNMNDSLSVPTATSFRELSVAALEARRRDLNTALQGAGRSEKVSFTHLIAWAIVQATRQHPVMGHTLATADGTFYRIEPDGISLGLAVDVTRKDGSRGLVVPVIKHAEAMDFRAFHAAYEGLVDKARANRLMPDDFQGATMTLTNPGGLGTVASVPRLMSGQGSIIAVGSIGYPAEFAAMPEERRKELGLSKVMTVTSTYDHRVIQGAESGAFLATLDHLLQGDERFYETIFESLGLGAPAARPVVTPRPAPKPLQEGSASIADLMHVGAGMALVKAFRTHGHLAARLDPLGSEPIGDPALNPEGPLGLTPEVMATIPARVLRVYVPGETLLEAYPNLQATYCGTIAYQIEHIASHEQRVWLREKIESGAFRTSLAPEERRRLLARLTEVEALESFLHKAYLGQKRFSIEGVDMLVPMLDQLIELAAELNTREVVLGMAHRGRLNVLAHTVGRPYETIFAEFEGGRHVEGGQLTPEGGTGDVKYHHGAEGAYPTRSGKAITVSLVPNPSHLEFVNAVVEGRARARQTTRRGKEAHLDVTNALPVLIHGDAAFAGQGVVAETLNLSALPAYRTGGTVHIITNNQVGFTTDMADARSTQYASDLAKGFDVPIIHVNADDPEACLSAARLAMAYRSEFARDVVIDLVGYRRHGHNEGDEPAYTQPLMYARIKELPTVRQRYADQLVAAGVIPAEEAAEEAAAAYQRLVDVQSSFRASMGRASGNEPPKQVIAGQEVHTAVPAELLAALNEQLLATPEGFAVHPKLRRQLDRRRTTLGPEGGIDWAHAEALALASLVTEGVPVRLTGQDTERGTFSQRQAVLHDVNTGATYTPLKRLAGALAPIELHNSPLSELAAMGFEYGYSAAAPEALVLWEAQFGDFANGAQVIIDQFLSAGLSKWGLTTRLTLLLPHGYEGQGPEHSSARLERFLQLSAEGNLRVAYPTTPAQYFHLLRRQAKRSRQRPLIVMTPKSLLRLPQATSRLEELSEGRWQPVLDDQSAAGRRGGATRLVLCSGKVYYDLLAEAENLPEERRPAIVRIEQLYSFPWSEMRDMLGRYESVRDVVWAQEEPQNMGAWRYVEPRLRELLPNGTALSYVGRPERASPAEGYPAAHAAEQSRIVTDALGVAHARTSLETMAAAGEGKA
jgi:2-oxoglutarate dehydrogenase E1 component